MQARTARSIKAIRPIGRSALDMRVGRLVGGIFGSLLLLALSVFSAAASAGEIETLREKAEAGEPDALFALAERHEQGEGVDFDLGLASALYEQAAKRGHGDAQYRFGLAQSMGLGGEISVESALGWLTLAARSEAVSSELAASLLESLGRRTDQQGLDQALAFADGFAKTS
ncbi:MAG: tetratricopeptide repeat protein, partial [Geminicoccaceae bacterium]